MFVDVFQILIKIFSAYDLFSKYFKVNNTQCYQFFENHAQKHTHTLHKYHIPYIPIIQGCKIPFPKKELENYGCVTCILFMPWRMYKDNQ